MHGKNGFRKHAFCRAYYRFEHPFVRIFSGTLGKLNDKGRAALHVAAEQAEALFHVVYVVSADRKSVVGDFVKLSSGDDHELKLNPKSEICSMAVWPGWQDHA